MTGPSNAIRDMLVKQSLATLKRKFNITAEPGHFPDHWDGNTIHKISEALGHAPTPGPEESITFLHKDIGVAGFLGHIVISVEGTMVYFHNR